MKNEIAMVMGMVLAIAGCKKDGGIPATPDLTESVTVTVKNDFPTKFDTINNLLNDTISFSIPHITSLTRLGTSPLAADSLIMLYGKLFSLNSTTPDSFLPPKAFRMYLNFPDASNFAQTISPVSPNSAHYDTTYSVYSKSYSSAGPAPTPQINFWRKYTIDGAAIEQTFQYLNYGLNVSNQKYNGTLIITVTKKKVINNILYITGTFSGTDVYYETSTWNNVPKFFQEGWSFHGSFTNLKWEN